MIGRFEENHIYNEDCYKAIKDIPDKSIDCIYTDIPYITSFQGGGAYQMLQSIQRKKLLVLKMELTMKY